MSNRDDDLSGRVRAQVGIGTLIVFIAMVLVAVIGAGILFKTAGNLQAKSDQAGAQSNDKVMNRLKLIQTTGQKTYADGDNEIGAVVLIATKAPNSANIEVQEITMQWLDDTGSYTLVHEAIQTSSVDGRFAHEPARDSDGSLSTDSPVINSRDDRVKLVIDLGASETSSGSSDIYDAYDTITLTDANTIKSTGLGEGGTASIRLTTQSGASTTVHITVPNSLTSSTSVAL